MKLPSFIRKSNAPRPALDEQLTAARAAHVEALAAVEQARARFDDLGDEASLSALLNSEAAAATCAALAARADRLVASALAAEQRAAHDALCERRIKLEAALAPHAQAARRAPSEQRLADVLVSLAKARAARLEVERELRDTSRELARVREQLGEAGPSELFHVPLVASMRGVVTNLERVASGLSSDDPLRVELQALIIEIGPAWRMDDLRSAAE